MRVLIADKFEQSGLDGLKAAGCEIHFQPGLKDEALAKSVAELRPDVLVVRSTAVGESALIPGALKLVVRAGAGYNTIDVATASRRGIYVSNCPGKNSVAVAELAFGLILSLDRRIPDNVASLRAGKWDKSRILKSAWIVRANTGIDRDRANRPRDDSAGAGLRTQGDRLEPKPDPGGGSGVGCRVQKRRRWKSRSEADIVSVHLALNAQTRGSIGAEFFAAMQPGAYFVNTARAEVIDQDALSRAIQEKGIRAALDVFANEPAGGTGEFTAAIAKEVYGTHHIGASTDQAQEAIAAETVRIITTFKDTGKVPNVVNLAKSTPATCTLIVRHVDRPGVLASVLDLISGARINVQEMENIVFEGAEAAVARINLENEPPETLLAHIRESNVNILELGVIRL